MSVQHRATGHMKVDCASFLRARQCCALNCVPWRSTLNLASGNIYRFRLLMPMIRAGCNVVGRYKYFRIHASTPANCCAIHWLPTGYAPYKIRVPSSFRPASQTLRVYDKPNIVSICNSASLQNSSAAQFAQPLRGYDL